MKNPHHVLPAFLGFLSICMVAGCSSQAAPITTMPGAAAQVGSTDIKQALMSRSYISAEAAKGALLYAADGEDVDVFTYPKGENAGQLTGLDVRGGICSDTKGDIFLPVEISASASVIYEYAHGGTSPIATLSDSGLASACSYDSTTGNLAVANNGPNVAIYIEAQGNPIIYATTSVPALFCAYDSRGNLFIDDGLDTNALAELPRGGSSFNEIRGGPA